MSFAIGRLSEKRANKLFKKKKKGETNVYDLLLCDIGMSDKQQGSPEP